MKICGYGIVLLLIHLVLLPPISQATDIWFTPSNAINPKAIPLGDQKLVFDAPRQGNLYACDPIMYQQKNGFDLHILPGPWVDLSNHTIDITKKLVVQGTNFYPNARFSVTLSETQRLITSNGLPVGVPAGNFPIAPSDPAQHYDGNPNPIIEQNISFAIPLYPAAAAHPSCVYKWVGITLDGVPLQTGLGDIGNDENGVTLQDACGGLSQPGGVYHRHFLSRCTPHISERAALVGYALDGFGIYSPYDQNGNELNSADLDECHGTTSNILWEGEVVNIYHYVMTRDFPYTVSCFKGTPTRNAFPALPGAPPEIDSVATGQNSASGAAISPGDNSGGDGGSSNSSGDSTASGQGDADASGDASGDGGGAGGSGDGGGGDGAGGD